MKYIRLSKPIEILSYDEVKQYFKKFESNEKEQKDVYFSFKRREKEIADILLTKLVQRLSTYEKDIVYMFTGGGYTNSKTEYLTRGNYLAIDPNFNFSSMYVISSEEFNNFFTLATPSNSR